MDKEAFEKHKPFAMTVEGRRPLLGSLVGNADAPDDSPEAPRVEPSPLGLEVQRCWLSIHQYYPEVEVLTLQLMPDHLHGILFVTKHMEQHMSMAIKGFKVGYNQAYRQLGHAATYVAAKEKQRYGRPQPRFSLVAGLQ